MIGREKFRNRVYQLLSNYPRLLAVISVQLLSRYLFNSKFSRQLPKISFKPGGSSGFHELILRDL